MRLRRRQATKVDWCLTHEGKRYLAFPEFCAHGYALWYYSETEGPLGQTRVSSCRFTKAWLEVSK